jgi:hypothetical protein
MHFYANRGHLIADVDLLGLMRPPVPCLGGRRTPVATGPLPTGQLQQHFTEEEKLNLL